MGRGKSIGSVHTDINSQHIPVIVQQKGSEPSSVTNSSKTLRQNMSSYLHKGSSDSVPVGPPQEFKRGVGSISGISASGEGSTNWKSSSSYLRKSGHYKVSSRDKLPGISLHQKT